MPTKTEPRGYIVRLHFGALAPTLKEQLADFDLPPLMIKHWQKDADAIVRLAVRELIPPKVADAAYQKIMCQINKALAE